MDMSSFLMVLLRKDRVSNFQLNMVSWTHTFIPTTSKNSHENESRGNKRLSSQEKRKRQDDSERDGHKIFGSREVSRVAVTEYKQGRGSWKLNAVRRKKRSRDGFTPRNSRKARARRHQVPLKARVGEGAGTRKKPLQRLGGCRLEQPGGSSCHTQPGHWRLRF